PEGPVRAERVPLLPARRGEGARSADEGPLTRPAATLSPRGGERGNTRYRDSVIPSRRSAARDPQRMCEGVSFLRWGFLAVFAARNDRGALSAPFQLFYPRHQVAVVG